MTSTPDDFYERARRRAATLEGLLVIARREREQVTLAQDSSQQWYWGERVKALERQLEDARYVGD